MSADRIPRLATSANRVLGIDRGGKVVWEQAAEGQVSRVRHR
jgi:hypothetical protein